MCKNQHRNKQQKQTHETFKYWNFKTWTKKQDYEVVMMTVFEDTKDNLDDMYREQETAKSNIANLNLKKNQLWLVWLNG